MRSSLDVGISYHNYQIAILDIAKAVSQFKLDAGAAGVPAHKSFDAAVTAYSDAGTLWQKSIDFFAQRGNAVSYGGSLPVGLTGTQWLIQTYNLPTQKADLLGYKSESLPTERAAPFGLGQK